ncbi:DUF2530 domain-containing protein [Agromyces sp. LHK192]|uniref:DUF2530 domain-containing protein n=1 Tax=Agromyces sp. LHK192 TaxID=2498704 RepID=UPI0013E35638|nr:DUF2530 domain-containing protein [Agromyces sp. LHK192]
MRLWLGEDERRPDPAPARADARKALATGTAAWLLGAGLAWFFLPALDAAGFGWLLPMSVIGFALGIAGITVVQVHRHRTGERGRRNRGGPTVDQSSED